MDVREPDWDALVAAVRRGGPEAFRRLFDASYREVRLFVSARASSIEMTDEIVQEAYVTAFESLAAFRPGGSFSAWIKGIARNLLRQELGRRRRLQPLGQQEAATAEELALAIPEDLGQRLDSCLDRLSAAARQLVALRYVERVPVQDIAARLGRTPSSVSVSLHRIRGALAECLGPEVMAHV